MLNEVPGIKHLAIMDDYLICLKRNEHLKHVTALKALNRNSKIDEIGLKTIGDGWKIAYPEISTPNTIVNKPEVALVLVKNQPQKLNTGFIDKQK